MNLIPMPKQTTYLQGNYAASRTPAVCAADFDRFSVAWKTFHMNARIASEGSANLLFFHNPDLGEEEYELIIGQTALEIISATETGAFRALATVSQIFSVPANEDIPCAHIHDQPDIPFRGVMITVPENTIPRMDYLYHLVDLLSLLKYNVFQLYFDSVVFEYGSLTRYQEGKTCISQEEIHALDAYCRQRHIELMANQEFLGHMHNWLLYDDLKELAIQVQPRTLFTLNPLSEKALDFAKTLADDLLPHYTSGHVHIGMDEAYGLGKYETEDYCRTFGEGTLLADYIGKLSNYIKQTHHKRSMLWGDYVVKYRDALKQLPKDVIICDWGYEPGHSFDRNILACHEQGLEVYVCPGTQTWGAFSGRTDIMVHNIFDAAEAARFHGAKGFLLTDWDPADFKLTSELSYAFGAAFSWNAGYNNSIAESGNEQNCRFRNKVVKAVLKYFDQAILKNDGERSCADIIYKMGNYYHFEQPDSIATWNGTQLYNAYFSKGLKDTDLSPEALSDIISYMERLRCQLEKCHLCRPDGAELISELLIEIDTVLAAANALGVKAEPESFAAPDTAKLLTRRTANWMRYNRPAKAATQRLEQIYKAFSPEAE